MTFCQISNPFYEPEPEDPEAPQDDDEDFGADVDALTKHYLSPAQAVVNHYRKQGVAPNPNMVMPIEWELEMGPAFAEAQAEAKANTEEAESSAPDVSVDAGAGEVFGEGPEAGSAEGVGSELGPGDLGSGDMAGPDFGGHTPEVVLGSGISDDWLKHPLPLLLVAQQLFGFERLVRDRNRYTLVPL